MADMNVQGGYFAPKNYLKVNTGGSHDENPNGGVQIGMDENGTPNMLEEGEPVYNDFVYSDNIYADIEFLEKYNLPKKYAGKLYSQIADDLFEEYSATPLDPISKNGADVMLNRLAQAQEEQKQVAEQKELEEMLASLSPEELDALGQQLAMEEQAGAEQQAMAQQAPEQAMAMQDATQMSPEMMALPGQAPMMAACGGHINRFDGGGWFTNAALRSVLADPMTAPVAFASGWKTDDSGNVVQNNMDEPGAEYLRQGLDLISEIPQQIMLNGLVRGAMPVEGPANAAQISSTRNARITARANKVKASSEVLNNKKQGVERAAEAYKDASEAYAKALETHSSNLAKIQTSGKAGGAKTKAAKKAAQSSVKLDEKMVEKQAAQDALDAARAERTKAFFSNAGNKVSSAVGNAIDKPAAWAAEKAGQLSSWYGRWPKWLREAQRLALPITTGGDVIGGLSDVYKSWADNRPKVKYGDMGPATTPRYDLMYPDSTKTVVSVSPSINDDATVSSSGKYDFSVLDRAYGGPIGRVNKFEEGSEMQRIQELMDKVPGLSPEQAYMRIHDAIQPIKHPLKSPEPNPSLVGQGTAVKTPATTTTGTQGYTPNRLSVNGRYIAPALEGLVGLYDVFQPADKLKAPKYNVFTPSGSIRLIDPRYQAIDTQQSLNALNNQLNATGRGIRNMGLGPGTAAAYLAADAQGNAARGTALANDIQMDEQLRNAAITGANNNEATRAQFYLGLDRYRQQALADMQRYRNQVDLAIQQANNQYDTQKWQAVSNQLNNGINAIGNIAQENWNMNMVNSNPYFEGYGIDPNGWMNYLASSAWARQALEEAEKKQSAELAAKGETVPSGQLQNNRSFPVRTKAGIPDYVGNWSDIINAERSKLSPELQLSLMGWPGPWQYGCGGKKK